MQLLSQALMVLLIVIIIILLICGAIGIVAYLKLIRCSVSLETPPRHRAIEVGTSSVTDHRGQPKQTKLYKCKYCGKPM